MNNLNLNLNTARAHNIKHNSPEVKDVCYFAGRVRHMLDVKKNHLRTAMQKSNNLSTPPPPSLSSKTTLLPVSMSTSVIFFNQK